MTGTNLPAMLSPEGEIVRLITAAHLLQAAGLVDLDAADVIELAEFTDQADHFAAITREAKVTVSDELVKRCDRRGKWTLHEGEWTVKSSSPNAGATKYDNELLADALDVLVKSGVIDEEAATAALEWVIPAPPQPFWKQKAAGVNALLKLGGEVAEAITACREDVEPPKRSAKVTRKH